MEKTGHYIYSVIATNEDRTFDAVPIGCHCEEPQATKQSSAVYTISHNGLACVVSDSEIKEYPLSRENMLAHQRVNEIVMKEFVVLPVKFCTIAENSDLIFERLLKSKREELISKLEYLKSKNEFGLKVLWKEMPLVFASIATENAQIKKMKERLEKMDPVRARDGMIEVGQMVKNALEAKKDDVGGLVFDRLAKLCKESKKNDVYGDRMLLNAVFLVERPKEKILDDEINRLADEYAGTMDWKYVGPTPAANFVEIVVSWKE